MKAQSAPTPLPGRDEGRSPAARPPRLSAVAIALYALPAAAVAFVYMLVLVMYMNFATDVLLVGPATIGAIFLVSRVWDAVSDPLVGFLSDRTRSRLGRRRSWILGSSLPLAVTTMLLWVPPDGIAGRALVAWTAVAVFGFYTAYTAFYVPHLALAAEIAREARDRNRIFGARQIAQGLGVLGAFALGAPLLERADDARDVAPELALLAASLCVTTILLAGGLLPREPSRFEGRGGRNLAAALRDVWRNPHARLLLFVFFIESFGMGATSAMAPYVVKYVIKMPGVLGPVLLAYFVSTALSIPVWVWLAGRIERHRLWRFAMGMSCVGYGSLAFLDEGRLGLQLFAMIVSGAASGCGNTLGQAIKADVIDWDEWATGERKEGSYFATWAFVGKLGGALMVGLAGLALGAAGYVENAEQTPFTKTVMLLLIGGAPALCFAIGLAIFRRFRLDGAEHARIMAEIAKRG